MKFFLACVAASLYLGGLKGLFGFETAMICGVALTIAVVSSKS